MSNVWFRVFKKAAPVHNFEPMEEPWDLDEETELDWNPPGWRKQSLPEQTINTDELL